YDGAYPGLQPQIPPQPQGPDGFPRPQAPCAPYGAPAYYGSPAYVEIPNGKNDAPVSLGEWLWSLLLLFVPIVGTVAVFIFAFGDSKPSKKNFFRALLIIALIAVVFVTVLTVVTLLGVASFDPGSAATGAGRV
ncbi:MAG: hypothetical protein IJV00_05565, partial [Clostridia bacterium]|nr:hypothetical protein [Clostridia bacterium]